MSSVASGSGDGVVKAWDLVSREETCSIRAHDGIVNGLCYTVEGRLLSCSTDKLIKLWQPGTKEVYLCLSFSNSSLFKRTSVQQDITPSTITVMKPYLPPLRLL